MTLLVACKFVIMKYSIITSLGYFFINCFNQLRPIYLKYIITFLTQFMNWSMSLILFIEYRMVELKPLMNPEATF
jgi:hypothetical protein